MQVQAAVAVGAGQPFEIRTLELDDPRDDEVLVRDLDMDQLAEVRNLWQFYRDRRPDQYGTLVQP